MLEHKWIYAVVIIMLTILIVMFVASFAHGAYMEYDETASVWTERMNSLHEAADILREYGYSDDSEVIQAMKRAWESEYRDLQIVAKVIEGEAGGCSYEQMIYTGVTIVNRKYSSRFAQNTIYDVVAAPGQYSHLYLKNFHTLNHKCLSAARDAIDGNHDAPNDLYWEALFPQGKETWKIVEFKSDYYQSTTYFCRGTIYD